MTSGIDLNRDNGMWFKRNDARKGPRDEVLPLQHEGAPDSLRPNGLCPRCGKQSSFESAGSLPVTFDYEVYVAGGPGANEPLLIDRVTSLVCRHCRQAVVVVEEEWTGEAPRKKTAGGGVISYRGIHWWPLPAAQVSADVPAEIAGAFGEAATALAAGCPRAAAVMARRTLEAITVEKGETTGSLAQRVKALSGKGLLHPSLAEWVNEVRLAGNIGAHFDPIQPMSKENAQELVNFIRELLKFLYEMPADLARRRGQSAP